MCCGSHNTDKLREEDLRPRTRTLCLKTPDSTLSETSERQCQTKVTEEGESMLSELVLNQTGPIGITNLITRKDLFTR